MGRPARERARIHLRLPVEPESVSAAQHSIVPIVSALEPALVDDVRLLVSELVTNSIRHGALEPEDWIELEVEVRPATLHVEIFDPGVGFDPRAAASPSTPDSPESPGWGLVFLEKIASRWGVDRRDGTCVWFEMDLGSAGA
jgi:anti-sigma regulatory factor (Ser/Thr protein kinase)